MADLDYARVIGRLAITVGDQLTGDVDDNPDVLWCDEGQVVFTPLVTEMKVVGDTTTGPFLAGNAPITCLVDSEGYVTYNGDREVWLIDLGSDKVNPQIPRNKGAYEVTFVNVRCQGEPVAFSKFNINPVAGETNDITVLSPVPGTGGTPIVQGPPGRSVASASTSGGNLLLTYDDGTTANAGPLPAGPQGEPGEGAYAIDSTDPDVLIVTPGSNETVDPSDSDVLVVVT